MEVLMSDVDQVLHPFWASKKRMLWYVNGRNGVGLSREDVMRLACVIAEKSGKKHPFHDGMAGRGWFDGFRACHPKLVLRTPQPLSYNRALCAYHDVTLLKWGQHNNYACLNLLSKHMLIFNMVFQWFTNRVKLLQRLVKRLFGHCSDMCVC